MYKQTLSRVGLNMSSVDRVAEGTGSVCVHSAPNPSRPRSTYKAARLSTTTQRRGKKLCHKLKSVHRYTRNHSHVSGRKSYVVTAGESQDFVDDFVGDEDVPEDVRQLLSDTLRSDTRQREARARSVQNQPQKTSTGILPMFEAQKQCYGCGAVLQDRSEEIAGYVDPEKFQTKKKHRHLGQVLCHRCHQLHNGAMVNAVSGQAQAPRHAKGLVTPEELRDQLKPLRRQKVLVLKVVDVLDFNGSFMNRIRDLVGSNPVLLVLTKADLLPKKTDQRAVEEWVFERSIKRGLNVAGVRLVSGRTGAGVESVVKAVLRERRGRSVYVIGAANVGKSSFVRKFLEVMAARDFSVYDVGRRLPTASPMPGTTLGTIALDAFGSKKSRLFDTPGVLIEHRLSAVLLAEELKGLLHRRRVNPFAPALPPASGDPAEGHWEAAPASIEGVSFVWGAVVRVDVLRAPPAARLCFLGPQAAAVATFRTAQLAESPGDQGWMPPVDQEALGAATVGATGGLRAVRDIRVPVSAWDSSEEPLVDVVPSGLGGWIGVFAETEAGEEEVHLRVWAPRGIEVFVRPPLPVEWRAKRLLRK